MPADMDEFWVFGYGSLMWHPGFEFEERQLAVVRGYHRALCIHSWVHRGIETAPGLVLGLERGGSCKGAAFRIHLDSRDGVVDYLRERELVTNVYLERFIPVRLPDGRRVTAITYVADRNHRQFAAGLSVDAAARIVANAEGKSGRNSDYVLNTVSHLRELGIRDQWIEDVADRMLAYSAAG
ncbi:gamma-glutamylcyclotransferase [Rhizobium sp. KVB221]|uniref:glutathione-specific gamma-glutamylcyclotransferase n=1 Tax=Rhizobium setariae TaxID=2801340 RepID=A0A936YQ76_9HYPH|nr:gamma-glutamylcyclotransferase [Rhizobium setariae]MBL0374710.1 gamma-glutamylcyclotransferase [Rhizobium setariae]